MEEIKYSIIVLVENTSNLDKTINSICTQKYDLEKIEIILINYSEDKNILDIVNRYNNFNIILKDTDKNNYIECLNDVISEFKGEYVSIINSNNYYYNRNTFSKIDKLKGRYEIISIQGEYENIDIKQRKLYSAQPSNHGNINLIDTPSLINLNFYSYFIAHNIIRKFKFDKNFKNEFHTKFLMDLLDTYNEYYYCNKVSIISLETYETSISSNKYNLNKEWYILSLDNFLDYIQEKRQVKKFMQYILLYIINNKIGCNIGDRDKKVLNGDEVIIFYDKVVKISNYIDNSILIGYLNNVQNKYKMRRWIAYDIARKKYSTDKKINVVNNNIIISYGDDGKIINGDVLFETVNVCAINYKKGNLYFDCKTSLTNILNEDEFEIHIVYCDEEIEITKTNIYSDLMLFGIKMSNTYSFKFNINPSKKGALIAYAVVGGKKVKLGFTYSKPQSHLSDSKKAFWHIKDIVLYNKISYINIKKTSFISNIISELKYDVSRFLNNSNKLRILKLITLRWLYYFTKPFYKNKHIWLTFDKLYKAGDNAEYVYQYGLECGKNIYYIVKKDSPDYERLIEKDKKHVLVFNSLKAKLFALHSEVVLKTHANILGFLGFDGIARVIIRDLFNAEIIEIQHGLTIQDIPQYQNRLVDNTKLYLIASKFEYNNIIKPQYDYSEEQIKTVGLGRYDGLINNDKKIILITPTWRHSVAAPSLKHGVPRGHNDVFKNTEYFKIYNSLINNKKFISCAQKNNYKIIYLIHPTLSGQIDDFDKNEFVDIIAATGDISYEQILTESSLMVTDYSGVQYDFAYMRKPILYFHPDELPPHYDSSINYERDGFGPIVRNENDLVDKLCDKMDNLCKNDDIYIERANKFFEFDDHNNCERIINEIDKYLDSI